MGEVEVSIAAYKRLRTTCAEVSGWLETAICDSAPADFHLRATLRCAIGALRDPEPSPAPRRPRAEVTGEPAPGESWDEEAERLAAACPDGEEERRAVVLRRAAHTLLLKAHGPDREYREETRRGPHKVHLSRSRAEGLEGIA